MFDTIKPKEAYAKMVKEGYHYLDVRTEEEFAAGHPVGATNIPLLVSSPEGRVMNKDFLQMVQAEIPADTKLVVGCASGGRAAKACEILANNGYANLCSCDGSFLGRKDPVSGAMLVKGWRDEGLPVA